MSIGFLQQVRVLVVCRIVIMPFNWYSPANQDWHHMFFTHVVMPQKINHKMNYGDFPLYKQCKAYENQTVRPGRWRYNSSTVPQSTSKTAKKLSSTIYLTYVTRRDQHLTLTTKLFMCKSYNFFGEMFTLKLWNNWV